MPKERLEKARAEAEFTPNSLYESAGTVTLTVSAEMAVFIYGMIGHTQPSVADENGKRIELYEGFWLDVKPVLNDLATGELKAFYNAGASRVQRG